MGRWGVPGLEGGAGAGSHQKLLCLLLSPSPLLQVLRLRLGDKQQPAMHLPEFIY